MTKGLRGSCSFPGDPSAFRKNSRKRGSAENIHPDALQAAFHEPERSEGRCDEHVRHPEARGIEIPGCAQGKNVFRPFRGAVGAVPAHEGRREGNISGAEAGDGAQSLVQGYGRRTGTDEMQGKGLPPEGPVTCMAVIPSTIPDTGGRCSRISACISSNSRRHCPSRP